MKTFRIFAVLIFAAAPVWAATATANLAGTKPDSPIVGAVQFEETSAGLKVTAEVKGTPPGPHGFHVHENGSCAEAGNAAGGHFNPDGAPHGLLTQDGFAAAHAGDLGNLEVGPDGTGRIETVLPGVNLTEGKYNVRGKAVILHEKADDFGQPTGNAGGRIACGIIE